MKNIELIRQLVNLDPELDVEIDGRDVINVEEDDGVIALS